MHLHGLFLLFLVGNYATLAATPSLPPELFSTLITQKVLQMASNVSSPPLCPEYTDASGKWIGFVADTWTTGFFPAMLYALNERASLCSNDSLKETDWLSQARQWSSPEVPLETSNKDGHDVGFVSFPFEQELLLDSSNQTAKNAVNAFTNELAARFDPVVRCTRSWDTANPSDFTVIIDNMMNLNVLFASDNLTGNDTLVQIAMSHADKTMENHVREDGSSFHVVEYDESTGGVIRRGTAQGFADNSTWSRGQSWGTYGFALMYQNTGDQRYLDTSRRMATYFTINIPTSGTVPWDFNAPDDGSRPADSSAAMITASALLLLADLEQSLSPPNSSGAEHWRDSALQLVTATTAAFWNPDWQSLLSNGTVDNRSSPPNNNTGIIYGDYYFITTGNQLISSGTASCSQLSNSASPNSTSGGEPSTSDSATKNIINAELTLVVLCMITLMSI